jgi:hypothetical protein
MLGLTQIAEPQVNAEPLVAPEGAALAPAQKGPIGEYHRGYKMDMFEIVLGPYEYVEYKYQLAKGATMVYSWSANLGVIHDFHGERAPDAGDGGPAEESFDKSAKQQSAASYTAPFAGIHGWYWENPGADSVTIRLTSAGFYEAAVEIRSDRTRRTRPLLTPGSAPPPSTGPGGNGTE